MQYRTASPPRSPALFCAFTALLALFTLHGCGPDADPLAFPSFEGDWVLEGLRCNGLLSPRQLSSHSTDDGLQLRYRRGDECVAADDVAIADLPTASGQPLTLLTHSDPPSELPLTVEQDSPHVLRLLTDDDREFSLRKVYEESNPADRFPEGVNLAGLWWMENYPCYPAGPQAQLVSIFHVGPTVSITKVNGDPCIGPDETFFTGSTRERSSLAGTANLLSQDPDTWPDGITELPTSSVSGSIRNDFFFTLAVEEHRVRFQKVYEH